MYAIPVKQNVCLLASAVTLCFSLVGSESLPIQSAPVTDVESKRVAQQTKDLFHQVVGIAELDAMFSQRLPKGNYVAVKTLRAWLASSIDTITECSPTLMALGKERLKIPALYAECDMKRVKQWCELLVKKHQQSRKRKMLPHELVAQDLLSSCVGNRDAQMIPRLPDLTDERDTKRYECEQIRRWIGSYFVLKAGRHAHEKYTAEHFVPTVPSNEVARVRGDAQSLYNELALEAYFTACDTHAAGCEAGVIPQELQHLIESFVYKPYQVAYDLHSAESSLYRFNFSPEKHFFLVENENFVEFGCSKNNAHKTDVWGSITTDATNRFIEAIMKNHYDRPVGYNVKEVYGNVDSHCMQISCANDKSLIMLLHMNQYSNWSPVYVNTPSAFSLCSVANDTMTTLWNHGINDKSQYYIERITSGRLKHAISISMRLDALATSDSGTVLCALVKDPKLCSQGSYTSLFSAEYEAGSPPIQTYDIEVLRHKLTDAVLAVSHSGALVALGGRTAEGQVMLAICSMDEQLHADNWRNLSWRSKKLTKLIFSRDDTQLFCAGESAEKKKTAATYGVMSLREKREERSFQTCKMPRLKNNTNMNLMSAIDPQGEYIGVRAQREEGTFCKVIPTDNHVRTKLVPNLRSLLAADRHMLYLLHTAITSAPGYAHISPQQWTGIFKRLGLREHLFNRARLCFTTTDGTKMWGAPYQKGIVPVRESSLKGCHAVYAASNLSDTD